MSIVYSCFHENIVHTTYYIVGTECAHKISVCLYIWKGVNELKFAFILPSILQTNITKIQYTVDKLFISGVTTIGYNNWWRGTQKP